ncbi:MAG: hypothetical protein F6K65_18620 [Moorea sp. SIO3C2]|nr:hypothetical protein [Moorena sp. SIO3C2]
MPTILICQEMNWSQLLHLHLVPVPPLLRGVRGDLSLPGWWAVPTQAYGKQMNLTPALPTLHLHLVPVPPLLRGVRGDLSLPGWWAVLTQAYGKQINLTLALPTLHLHLVPVPPLLRGVRGDLLLPGWWAVLTQAYGKQINLTPALPTLHISGYDDKNQQDESTPNAPYISTQLLPFAFCLLPFAFLNRLPTPLIINS